MFHIGFEKFSSDNDSNYPEIPRNPQYRLSLFIQTKVHSNQLHSHHPYHPPKKQQTNSQTQQPCPNNTGQNHCTNLQLPQPCSLFGSNKTSKSATRSRKKTVNWLETGFLSGSNLEVSQRVRQGVLGIIRWID